MPKIEAKSFGYLERAHKVLCELAVKLTGLQHTLALEGAMDIEAFVKMRGRPNLLNRLHATRHAFLPDTAGKE